MRVAYDLAQHNIAIHIENLRLASNYTNFAHVEGDYMICTMYLIRVTMRNLDYTGAKSAPRFLTPATIGNVQVLR